MVTDSGYSQDSGYYDEPRGMGWTAFAGIMIMLSGSISFVQGLWALDHKNNASAKAAATQLSYGNLDTWGWIVLIWGIVVFCAGIAIFAVSTYYTDYVFVKTDRYTDAIAALESAGHTVTLSP